MSSNALEIRLLDRVFHVSCPKDREEALLNAAKRLNEEVEAIYSTGKLDNLEQILVMVALNASNELQRVQDGPGGHEILERIGFKIDRVLQQEEPAADQ